MTRFPSFPGSVPGLSALALVAACASPAPEFFGATRSEVTLSGIDFVVFHTDDRAEVVRMGYLSRPARAAVPALMVQAAEQVSGCKVRKGSFETSIQGDTGEARMDLTC